MEENNLEKENTDLISKYTERKLIGTGSNGNRVYRVLNKMDNNVKFNFKNLI